ncbi:MAG: phosphatidylserine decarboxylase [Flavobacterium sp. BFFFF2]|nr:MAG: phosphatidylserine decarboxylase [Flavobacterium sp. BFFFF2]
MTKKDLDTRFWEAFEIASNMTESLPQDVMLRIYSYYKQATSGSITPFSSINSDDVRNAFKMNAWMQVGHLSPDQAKELYIQTIESVTSSKKD